MRRKSKGIGDCHPKAAEAVEPNIGVSNHLDMSEYPFNGDWLSVLYLFDRPLPAADIDSLLTALEPISGGYASQDGYKISYTMPDGESDWEYHSREELSNLISTSSYSSTVLNFDQFTLYLKQMSKAELLNSQPHLLFKLPVHAFKGPIGEESDSEAQANRLAFVEMLTVVAETLQPRLGVGNRGANVEYRLPDQMIDGASVDTLFEYNIYAPETVEKLGQEDILSAPAWHVAELSTGGPF